MSKIKIIFMGTSAFAVPALKRLLDNPDYSVSVCTRPDCQKGRGLKTDCSEVKKFLLENYPQAPVLQPKNLKEKCSIDSIQIIQPELIVVASYGLFLPKIILEAPKMGCLNIHPSLLPKYRGPSPIQTAILNQDSKTGVSIIKLNDQMDAGDILAKQETAIDPETDFTELHQKLAELGAELLIKTIPLYCENKIKAQKQDPPKATFTKIIKKEDGLIDWNKNALQIDALVRAFNPWPKTYTFFTDSKKEKKRLNIIRTKIINDCPLSQKMPAGTILRPDKDNLFSSVVTKNGQLLLEIVQPEGKKLMKANDFFRGQPNLTQFV